MITIQWPIIINLLIKNKNNTLHNNIYSTVRIKVEITFLNKYYIIK